MRVVQRESTLSVFSVGTDCVQITWSHCNGPMWFEHGDTAELVRCRPGQAGAHLLKGLTPDTDYEISVYGIDGVRSLTARTLAAPSGPELYRFATLNDLHLGHDRFGALKTIREPHAGSALRCALSLIHI